MAATLHFLLPVEEDDFDCALVLLPPPAPDASAAQEQPVDSEPASKRQKMEQLGAAQVQGSADAPREMEAEADMAATEREQQPLQQKEPQPQEAGRRALKTSSVLLKMFSPKFRNWIARWTGAADEKELVMQCRSEAEEAGYRHLLAFIHSMGKEMPEGLEDLIQLLLLAREHAVEQAVLACMQPLQQRSGASDHNEIQAEADKLLEAVHKQLCSLLPADGVGQGASAKHQLLQYLGPLQDMLNNERRRKVFTSIPFGLLRDCIFADENVEADSETTVLAAFAYWMERYPHPFGIDLKQHTAVICSRIRFPAIPPSVLSMFYKHCSFIHIFDSDKELLIRAISSAAEPSLADEWHASMADGSAPGLKAKCECWWLPRPRPLATRAAPAVFVFQPAAGLVKSIRQPAVGFSGFGGFGPPPASAVAAPEYDAVFTAPHYFWAGLFWNVSLQQSKGLLGIFIRVVVSPTPGAERQNLTKEAYTMKVKCSIRLCAASSTDDFLVRSTTHFSIGQSRGWAQVSEAAGHGGKPITWDGFWAEGSRVMHNGAARVQLELSVPDS